MLAPSKMLEYKKHRSNQEDFLFASHNLIKYKKNPISITALSWK